MSHVPTAAVHPERMTGPMGPGTSSVCSLRHPILGMSLDGTRQ